MNRPHLAKDIMVTNLVTLTPETEVWSGIVRLLRNKISGAPVVDQNGLFQGVFSEKCCLSVLIKATQQVSSEEPGRSLPQATEIMTTKLVTLSPADDVFDSIGFLLKKRISGAPVVDANGQLVGSFSEKTSMKVLLDSAYDQLPTSQVTAFMDPDPDRKIGADLNLLEIAEKFDSSHFRRLPVVSNGQLLGQISRRDVLNAGLRYVGNRGQDALDSVLEQELTENTPEAMGGKLASQVMDAEAETIHSQKDLLSIAQLFLTLPCRRLPVVSNGQLEGQVSRRDVLHATNDLIAVDQVKEPNLLYLSSLKSRSEAPIG